MAYREDKDLEFLGLLKSEDLNDLVYCLTHDKDGTLRFTEELTLSSEYKKYNPDHCKYWELIAAELQCFGANSFVTIFRGGKGVVYREVLTDVCDKMSVKYDSSASVERIEMCLLEKIMKDSFAKMSPTELAKLAEELGIEHASAMRPEMITALFIALFRSGGFLSYQITLIVANAILKVLIGRGLTFGGNMLLTRTAAILVGPIGWIIAGLWTAIDIAGAAYRVTIPSVIQVAVLRQKYLYEAGNMEVQVS